MAVVTLLTLVQLVVGIVQLARGEKAEQGTVIFVAYLLGAFATVPAAGLMSLTERTRWGSITVAAAWCGPRRARSAALRHLGKLR